MKRFMAVFTGSPEAFTAWSQLDEATRKSREQQGMKAWGDWMNEHKAIIAETGGPLGKTKRIGKQGITDIKNNLAGYVVVQADSHDAAARLFLKHPHFMIFPGDAVEVMECLPIPGAG